MCKVRQLLKGTTDMAEPCAGRESPVTLAGRSSELRLCRGNNSPLIAFDAVRLEIGVVNGVGFPSALRSSLNTSDA